jgi:hypothetical protein
MVDKQPKEKQPIGKQVSRSLTAARTIRSSALYYSNKMGWYKDRHSREIEEDLKKVVEILDKWKRT